MKLHTFIRQGTSDAQLEAQIRQKQIRLQVKQLCCGHGVPVILLSMYMSYAFELDKLRRQEVSGEALAMEADMYRAKWVARGLLTAVLEDVRSQVFNIPAPTP